MIENQPSDLPSNQPPLPIKKSRKGLIITLIVGFILLLIIGFLVKDKFNQTTVSNEYVVADVESIFSAPAYDEIHYNYKTFIYHFLDVNNYLDGTYFMTKIPDRAKKVFAFGNFTDDGQDVDDMAVILEKNDFKSSKLVIFNRKGELLFIEDYDNELPVINSFPAGSKIFLEESTLINAPTSGLIVQRESSKYVVIYDKKSKKFNSYYQYTENDINNQEEEFNDHGDYDDEVEETQPEPPAAIVEPVKVKKETAQEPPDNPVATEETAL